MAKSKLDANLDKLKDIVIPDGLDARSSVMLLPDQVRYMLLRLVHRYGPEKVSQMAWHLHRHPHNTKRPTST